MKTRPKLLQICLTVLLLASPVTLLAQYTFTTNSDGSLTITQYTGPGGDVIIPSTINGNPVTGVGPYAFRLPGDPLAGYGANRIVVPTSIINFTSNSFAQVYTYSSHLSEIYFQGNTPVCTNIFDSFSASFPIVYYLSGTAGWGTNFNNRFSQVWYPGELIMTLSPTNAIIDGAEWRVDGGVWQTNSGMIDHLAYGNHTISFKTIHGWRAPADQIVFVGTNFITTATANSYSALPGGPSQPTLQVLHTPGGNMPLTLFSNTLYGAGSGMIYALNTDGTAFTNIYSFTNGSGPSAGLTQSGNILYGTTGFTVFRINLDGTGFTNVCSSNISQALGGVILSGNTLYGTTFNGGTNGEGAIYAVNTDGTGFATLHSFGGLNDGFIPHAGLVASGNTLFGATFEGDHGGTPFAIQMDGTGYTNYPYHGYYPAGMTLSSNTLYGTSNGGVFKMNTDGTHFTNIVSLSTQAGVILAGTTLYGTIFQDPSARYSSIPGYYGTVFAIRTDGTGFTNLYYFTAGSDGAYPQASVLLSGTTLFGTTVGTTSVGIGNGTVFMLSFPPPQLNVTPSGTNVILTWPDGVHGAGYDLFSVQTATNLASPLAWTTLATPPVSVNGWNTVTNPLPIVPTFYRLTQ